MKKYICILAGAALLAACEQKTETVAPAPAEKKTENNTTIVNPSPAGGTTKTETNTTNILSSSPSGETKTESSTSTTTSTPSGH